MKDVTNRTEVFDYNGKFENEIALPGLGTVSGFGGIQNRHGRILRLHFLSVPTHNLCIQYKLKKIVFVP